MPTRETVQPPVVAGPVPDRRTSGRSAEMLRRMLERLKLLGTLPGDSADEQLKKATLTFFSLMMCLGGVLWGAVAAAFGRVYPSLIPFSYTVIVGVSVVWFARSRRFGAFRFAQLSLSLLLPFAYQWSLGGYAASGAMMLWALVAPLGALMFVGPKSSLGWLGGYVALIVVSGFLDPVVRGLAQPIPPSVQSALFVANISAVSAGTFFVVFHFIGQNLRTREELQSKKDVVEDQARKLVELDSLKTDFFNNVTHELRTPITLTVGPIEEVVRGRYGQIPARAKEELRLAQRNQGRLLALVNQILDLAKFDHGQMQLRAVVCRDANRFVQRIAETFRSPLAARGVELRLDLDPGAADVELYLDPEKVDKALVNLLSNAAKFTEKGEVAVVTRLADKRLVVSVDDTGIGIDAEDLPFIFDRFRQARGASSQYGGTGIGLALVREVARLHHGDIETKSRPGEGSSFAFVLPLGRDHLSPAVIGELSDEEREQWFGPGAASAPVPGELELEDSAAQTPAQNIELEAKHDPARPTVLYVDDNLELRRYLRDVLGEHYNVYLASNGADGFAKAKACRPDLILADLMMPVMNGAELCAAVRAHPELRLVPFVLLTARPQLDSKITGLELGADDYLTKPFSRDELLARIRNLIALRQNHLKLQAEIEAARKIQLALLPEVPFEHDGFELSAMYHPAEKLSGDSFFYVPFKEWLYFYLADVTSHGTAAAQVTYLVKELFQGVLAEGPAQLPALARRLYDGYRCYQLGYDVAFHLGRCAAATRVVECVRGGAPPAVRVGDSKYDLIQPKPLPQLSSSPVVDGIEWDVGRVQLAADESLLLFTDGCYEFAGGGRPFGMKRLLDTLQGIGGGRWNEAVLTTLVAANGSSTFEDDLTILRLHARG